MMHGPMNIRSPKHVEQKIKEVTSVGLSLFNYEVTWLKILYFASTTQNLRRLARLEVISLAAVRKVWPYVRRLYTTKLTDAKQHSVHTCYTECYRSRIIDVESTAGHSVCT